MIVKEKIVNEDRILYKQYSDSNVYIKKENEAPLYSEAVDVTDDVVYIETDIPIEEEHDAVTKELFKSIPIDVYITKRSNKDILFSRVLIVFVTICNNAHKDTHLVMRFNFLYILDDITAEVVICYVYISLNIVSKISNLFCYILE